jgi:hypothetical protein
MSAPAAPERPEFFERLPSFEPGDELWARVVARRAANQRRSRALTLGSIALLGLAIAIGWRVGVRAPDGAALANAPAHEAELKLARESLAPAAANARDVEARLARVDAELQSAYDRHAGHDEIARLWRARGELESALLAAYQRPADLVRL